jgi:hypothetical protein
MNPAQKWLLLTSSVLTACTGLIYWWMDWALQPLDEWAVINHPLQPLVLKLHILVAPVLVFAVGLIAVEHIWRHMKSAVQRGRLSGLVTVAVLAPMVLTGYLIQTVTHPGWLSVLAWSHIGTGLFFSLGLVWHWATFLVGRVANGSRAAHPMPGEVRDPATRLGPGIARLTSRIRPKARSTRRWPGRAAAPQR